MTVKRRRIRDRGTGAGDPNNRGVIRGGPLPVGVIREQPTLRGPQASR